MFRAQNLGMRSASDALGFEMLGMRGMRGMLSSAVHNMFPDKEAVSVDSMRNITPCNPPDNPNYHFMFHFLFSLLLHYWDNLPCTALKNWTLSV